MSDARECSIKKYEAGLSLIELLIALGIGLFMIVGIVSLVVSVSQSRVELDKTSEQIENGRYAIQVISDQLHSAGFYGVPQPSADVDVTPSPCALPTTLSALQFGFVAPDISKLSLPVPVYGYASGATLPTCLSNASTGSEALVVRQVGSIAIKASGVGVGGTIPYVQISANKDLDGTAVAVIGKETSNFSLHDKNGNLAWVRKYAVRSFYLAGCDDCSGSGDGIPTLKMYEMSSATPQLMSLVEGVEDIHFEYGLDIVGSDNTSSTHDGSPDCYVTDPGVATAPTSCTVGTWITTSPFNWSRVTSVRIHVLARSVEATPSWTDTKTYDLGRIDGSGNTVRSGPFNDHFKRQVYTVVVTLNNVRGGRE